MTGAELLNYVRNDILRDVNAPFLWSDRLIFQYLSEAQDKFARRTYALVDNETFTITTVNTVREYDLDERVLFVFSARVETEPTEMGNPTRFHITDRIGATTGTPLRFITDEASTKIMFDPVPDGVHNILLRAARTPLANIDATEDPEIPSRFHTDLAEYAAYKCLIANDVDGSNVGAATRHKDNWNVALRDAKWEYFKLRNTNNPRMVVNFTGRRSR